MAAELPQIIYTSLQSLEITFYGFCMNQFDIETPPVTKRFCYKKF